MLCIHYIYPDSVRYENICLILLLAIVQLKLIELLVYLKLAMCLNTLLNQGHKMHLLYSIDACHTLAAAFHRLSGFIFLSL